VTPSWLLSKVSIQHLSKHLPPLHGFVLGVYLRNPSNGLIELAGLLPISLESESQPSKKCSGLCWILVNIIAPMAAKWRNRLLLNKSSVPTIALSILAQGAEEQGSAGARECGGRGAREHGRDSKVHEQTEFDWEL
jgi:hypothetical protein